MALICESESLGQPPEQGVVTTAETGEPDHTKWERGVDGVEVA